ncbi:alpha/beta fold hydrolase [Novosphingobium sp. FSY-8]|uniref:Alpha/beta fold hydrolase n=1 Tax=Novosphingobium ovatum TaxID=1908523 RepID=A0ABW9XEZ8_9SPHN|nr:alpha/beta fold hydrolase [Novosphingobium ovatum]NBC37119.1 alpha/beta fold hydrolase [Novosphingobium ovatum]
MITKAYAATDAGQVHYRHVAGDGVPVVLLHRTPVCSSGFDAVLRFFAARGRAAYALDTPGFGASFMPDGAPSAADYGNWLAQALAAIGLTRYHLAAHHTGTHFATEIAAAHPDRVASLTLSGVLLAPADERPKLRADIGHAPDVDADGTYMADTFKLMKSLFLDPAPALVHDEVMGALVSGHGRDLAFDAIFAQDFAAVLGRAIGAGVPVQVVQAADDPLTLNGMLGRLRELHPTLPVTITGPAFLATPERQSGAFARAVLDFAADQPQDIPMTNRRYELVQTPNGYDLARADGPIPVPGEGEVLVRVRAVSLNRRDLGVRDLSYPVNGADHFLPLSDAAGDVVAVGPGVTGWAVGDRVTSTFFQHHPGGRLTLPAVLSSLGAGGPGVFADHVVLAAGGLAPIPDGWTYAQAACLPCAGVTAWSALMTLGRLQKGDRVLVIGTGGVALFAVQIAAAAGAQVIILSSSADKIAKAKALGATDAINYRDTPDWAEEVRKRTGGMGVDHVVELGGVGTLPKSIAALGLNGHLALIGALDGFGGEFSALPLIFSALRVSAVMVGSRADHLELAAFMAQHGITPVIDSTFAFDDAEAAYARANEGAFGKVVIEMGEP